MSKLFDVLGLGAVAVDELIYVDTYPPPDEKAHVLHTERQCGGLTATALVAASRFGACVGYAGVLGTDTLSMFARDAMTRAGVHLEYLREEPEVRPVHSYIIVDRAHGTRNIFADARGVIGAAPDWPSPTLIENSKVLFVDHLGLPGMLRAARIARTAKIPIVADLERDSGPEFHELLHMVDHLVISLRFASLLTGEAEPAGIADALWSSERSAVILTAGEHGCWVRSVDEAEGLQKISAFPVKAIDTTGCGDVFHGVYAAALANGFGLRDRIRFASAAAALKATQAGGQNGIPTRAELTEFLLGASTT